MSQLPDTTTWAGQREVSELLMGLAGLPLDDIPPTNLYDPPNMWLAWWVLNWAIKQRGHVGSIADWWTYEAGGGDGIDPTGWLLLKLSPADAQRVWLDKVLSLAIQAGMVKNEPPTP